MAKLNCPCGNQLSNVMQPNRTEGLLFSSYQDERYWHSESVSWEAISDEGRDIWECSECGRLAVSWPDPKDVKVKWFLPEDGEYLGVMHAN